MPPRSRRPPGADVVLTTDALVGGVHFFPDDPPDTIARKALRVNLSDLAAKGAKPAGFLLSLALPQTIGAELARGLRARPGRRCAGLWVPAPGRRHGSHHRAR